MSYVRCLLLLVLVTLIASCSDDTTSPNTNGIDGKGSGGDGIGKNDFAIVALSKDTVYWGDTLTITLQNARINTFTAFVHTLPFIILNTQRNTSGAATIQVKVADNSATGVVRIYEHDTLQAKGKYILTVIPQNPGTLKPQVFGSWPDSVLTGDLLVINGRDLPLLKRDITVSVDGIEMPVVTNDSLKITVRVTPEVRSGNVSVRVFTKQLGAGWIDKLEFGGELMQEGEFWAVGVMAKEFQCQVEKQIIRDGDTTFSLFEQKEVGMYTQCNSITDFTRGDSIVLLGNRISRDETAYTEIRLKPEANNRVSGRIRNTYVTYSSVSWIEVQFTGLRWLRNEAGYLLRTYDQDAEGQVISFECKGEMDQAGIKEINYIRLLDIKNSAELNIQLYQR